MRRSTGFKKRILLLGLIPVFGLLAVLVPLWFFMHYRFKESVRYLVARESKGRFTFDATDAGISLWKGTITLKDALLYGHDSIAGIRCKVRVPEIYFSLASWKALIVDKKLVVDSVAIIAPVIELEIGTAMTGRPHTEFRTSDILDALGKTLVHLNVHAFSLKDASFTVTEPGSSMPLHGEHIDLTVSNFASLNGQDNHFLGSDKVSLSLGPQHWVLPHGGQMIDFGHLSFDSREQRFELDSFFFRQKIAGTDRVFRLSADRFFFNSRHLPAIYQQSQLLLDTLICQNPVLSIPGDTSANHNTDSIGDAGRETMFKWINIRFVEVMGGRVLVQNRAGHSDNVATRSANLRIYNLRVDPSKPAPLSTDSIRMDLSNIQFLTRDSLYRLSIGAFELHGNDALFKEVNYGPTRMGLPKQVVFTAPALLVKDISIPDLLRRHIRASAAQLMAPQIRMSDNREIDTASQQRRQAVDAKKIALFYHTLHNIRELIDTRDFDLVHGSVSYIHTGRARVTAIFTGLSAHILLNKFFISDSLVDIKHAIPHWRIDKLELVAPGLRAEVEGYDFNGLGRRSIGEHFLLRTDKGWQVDGSNISWDVLDWDGYQRTKVIQINSLHLGSLTVHVPKRDSTAHGPAGFGLAATGSAGTGSAAIGAAGTSLVGTGPTTIGAAAKKPLPAIRIAVLDVDSITFDQPNAYGALHFGIDRLHITAIRQSEHTFVWDHANVMAHDVGLDTKQGRVDIRQVRFDTESGVSAKDLRMDLKVKGNHVILVAPLIAIHADLHSSDPGLLTVTSVNVSNAAFEYTGAIGKNTLTARGLLTIEARPKQLSPSFSSSVNLSWKETDLAIRGDSMELQAKGISGAFHDQAFSLPVSGHAAVATNDLNHWLEKIDIYTADLTFATTKITARAAGCSWDPAANRLRLTDFSVLPNNTRDETFQRSRWQMDFITVGGRALTLSGLQLSSVSNRITAGVDKMTLDGVSVEASRDKHMPFHHGIEKPMPTKLIGSIPFALRVDTTVLVDGKVTYHELSLATNRWSSIPIGNINGYVFHIDSRAGGVGGAGGARAAGGAGAGLPGGAGAGLPGGAGEAGGAGVPVGVGVTSGGGVLSGADVSVGVGATGSRHGAADTLIVEAQGRLFDGDIRRFYYAESYGDSLSAFMAKSSFSKLDLTRFSQALIPAAAVSIVDGHVDTVWSGWQGNKYATYGILDLDYDKLRIRVLNKRDSLHRGIAPAFETWAARLLLRGKNTKTSLIWFERDREKFVFNYWVKAQASGVLSTLLRIKNEQYRKAYEQKFREYGLPPGGLLKERQ
jgi:hypothetical protein